MGHGTNAVSPFLARPLLNHVQFPKQQGNSMLILFKRNIRVLLVIALSLL